MKLTIVGLGTGDYRRLTLEAYDALRSGAYILLRTAVHGVAEHLDAIGVAYTTLDYLYTSQQDFDDLLEALSARIAASLNEHREVVYAVPGGAGLFDASIAGAWSAAQACKAELAVLPGVGAAEEAAALSGGFASMMVMPAGDCATLEPDPHYGLMCAEVASRLIASDLKIRLLDYYPADCAATLIHRGQARRMPLEELDRQGEYDHSTALVLPPMELMELERYGSGHLRDVMDILLGENGCPWDKEQTHESLMPYVVEEAHEVCDAIRRGDMDHLYDELGDVMLQVYFHAALAERHGEFALGDITTAIVSKMISRHTHIFGADTAETAAEVLSNWEAIKKTEKGLKNLSQVMRDIPRSFPPLLRMYKVLSKAKNEGGVWTDGDALINEMTTHARALADADGEDAARHVGLMLMYAVMLSHTRSVKPDMALSETADAFIERVERIEAQKGALTRGDWDTFLNDMVRT